MSPNSSLTKSTHSVQQVLTGNNDEFAIGSEAVKALADQMLSGCPSKSGPTICTLMGANRRWLMLCNQLHRRFSTRSNSHDDYRDVDVTPSNRITTTSEPDPRRDGCARVLSTHRPEVLYFERK
jgi:hypothetical protein